MTAGSGPVADATGDQSLAEDVGHRVVGRRVFLTGATLLLPLHLAGTSGCAADRSVLVTGGVSAERATAYRSLAQHGIAAVEDLWGTGSVPAPIQLDLPANAAAWAAATGRQQGSGGEYAASTVWQDSIGRIVVNPATWGALTPEGRVAVMTHEVTHLAMGRAPDVPWWITEGMAEYTAHRASELSLREVAGSALVSLAAEPPGDWPTPSGAADPWQDYAPAWLACVYLARTYDESSLLDLHSDLVNAVGVDKAMQRRCGSNSAQVHQDWLRWLAEQ
ncbi:MAG: hypothetical protein WBG76_02565 [Ornithinimicrobium sp.]